MISLAEYFNDINPKSFEQGKLDIWTVRLAVITSSWQRVISVCTGK